MEVALREREKRLEEIKLAKSKESTVDPRLLMYQQKVSFMFIKCMIFSVGKRV